LAINDDTKISWPPAGRSVAAYGQDLMTGDSSAHLLCSETQLHRPLTLSEAVELAITATQ